MAKSEEFIKALEVKATEYIDECLNNTKEVVSNSKGVVDVKDRHIPTIDFFLRIWMPRNHGETINRDTWYNWIKQDNNLKSDTIKKINETFKALATDIVANEGKGIFYAKNRLGMTDKQELTEKVEQNLFVDPDE